MKSSIELKSKSTKSKINPKSLKSKKLKKLKTAQTVINTNTEINQAWLDANRGPYSVQGGSEANVIEMTFLEKLNTKLNVKQDTYFIIETDYVSIDGNGTILNFENIKDYVGLVQNTKFSNIIVSNIRNSGKNSSLLEKSGWFLGSDYGLEAKNNEVSNCKNYLPILRDSGGIVGQKSNIHAIRCENNGKFVSGSDEKFFGSGICALFCTGNIEECVNNSDMQERCGGMTYYTTKNINIKDCSNYGKIGTTCSGMIAFAEPNEENNNELNIENCVNYGNIGNDSSGMCYNSYINTNIKNCKNLGNIVGLDGNSSGMISFAESIGEKNIELNIENCENRGEINNNSSGICYVSTANTNINNCRNNGNIKIGGRTSGIISFIYNKANISNCNNYANVGGEAGIVYGALSDDIEIKDCNNYGNLDYYYSAGIIKFVVNNIKINNCNNLGELNGFSSAGIVYRSYKQNVSLKNCKNNGTITGQNSGGICSLPCPITVKDCKNHGVINGVGCGGIFGAGAPKGSNAINCVNNATINGENAGGIFGAWSQGTAKKCKNGGKLIGLNAQPILGYKSTGKIE